ncbi:hypothetical protein [Flavobacterium humidisoli]|uniref:Uncharacterized protein n=1 Tax=Flavobacterium humidisoli TaxID=2937442 RepID=A0ABY4LV02_9FLAO|nr:hypothetical protein [Flavobacterium humidisoli]UPZ16657.1 hypothetical protein M0M44_04780 [Flavobacterium humidisoli]
MILNFARFIGIKNVFIDTFPVVETTGYVEKRCLKENIACGFSRRNTESIHNDFKFCKVIGIKNVFIDTFPVVETTGYVERYGRENIACGFNRRKTESIHNDCKFCKVYRD